MGRTMDLVRIDGAKLRRIRLERFLDIGEVAARSGIHRDHISRLERGEWTGGSRPSTVRKLAAALEVDPDELIARE
jgi:transcriptional regulator with XRE-family HTH domain